MAIMSTRVGWVDISGDSGRVALLIAIVRPGFWREGGGARWCEGAEVGFIVPRHTRRSRGGELIVVWRLGSGGWLKVEEGGLIGVDGADVAASRGSILLRLLWFDSTRIGGRVAKSLDEFVVLGYVAGKHVGRTIRIGRHVTLSGCSHGGDDEEEYMG